MPQADASGAILHSLKGKPAALVDRLPGGHQLAPDADHCAQVGAMLARILGQMKMDASETERTLNSLPYGHLDFSDVIANIFLRIQYESCGLCGCSIA